jgi:VIT1/CCC1 family predicted Fe2+/Mn2+ transporter
MKKETFAISTPSSRRRTLAKTLVAVALGALIGVLVGAPYDQVFGLSTPLCTVLRSLVSTAAFASLVSEWPTEIVIDRM